MWCYDELYAYKDLDSAYTTPDGALHEVRLDTITKVPMARRLRALDKAEGTFCRA